jgi:hypothetical protein
VKDMKALISYVIREADGIESLKLFISSLDKFGVSRDNIVHIGIKDASRKFIAAVSDEINSGTHAYRIELRILPSGGFDIGSHFLVAQRSKTTHIIFMTATSQANRKNWDKILLSGFSNNSVGIIGSMKSSESIKSSFMAYLNLKINLFCRFTLSPSDKLIARARGIKVHSHETVLISHKFQSFSRSLIKKILFFALKSKEPYCFVNRFPEFPNPHLRTTGLAINRDLFLSIFDRVPEQKFEAYEYESGSLSLSARASLLGWTVLVADFYGTYHDLLDKNGNETFRWINGKSLVSDRESRNFHLLSLQQKRALQILSHG